MIRSDRDRIAITGVRVFRGFFETSAVRMFATTALDKVFGGNGSDPLDGDEATRTSAITEWLPVDSE
ncbi:MAG: hypothetical protein AB8B55_18715 [Mariniblastus sp.]